MKIAGLQKTTLIDYPGKVACALFLFGCNFRCGFCHNPELVTGKIKGNYSEEKVLEFLKKRKGKLDAVCITGGEPLINLDFNFLKKIKDLGYLIKIDTNGHFPDKLKKLIDEKLVDNIAMDIKASPKNYSKVAGIPIDLKKIEESIKLIHNFNNYEFRTTIVNRFHDAEEVKAIGQWLKKLCGEKPRKYFLQGFKKQENLLDKGFLKERNVTEKILEGLKENIQEFFKEVEIRV
ncbi:MAG: anaerobic ribonucleoside-triphosphate reductase activating protein [archaeon]|nr:anaerobic ribonucleoside-triphosphate reductase activating protein [archaeon]MCR4323776.1 anaerobic ribonucleoside-triphosphate reductase activating protein [Nanoarchaeota archaeon]